MHRDEVEYHKSTIVLAFACCFSLSIVGNYICMRLGAIGILGFWQSDSILLDLWLATVLTTGGLGASPFVVFAFHDQRNYLPNWSFLWISLSSLPGLGIGLLASCTLHLKWSSVDVGVGTAMLIVQVLALGWICQHNFPRIGIPMILGGLCSGTGIFAGCMFQPSEFTDLAKPRK